jgi:membrane fusion protein (multidrug efflux system)
MTDRRNGNDEEVEEDAYGRREYDHASGEHERPPNGGRRAYDRSQQDGHERHEEPRGERRDEEPRGERRDEEPRGERRDEEREKRPEERRHADHDKQRGPQTHRAPSSFRRLGIGIGIALFVAALAAGLLYWRHHHRIVAEGRSRQKEVDRGPRIFVAAVLLSPGARELTLPADVRGFFQSTVYAKTSGYVKSIAVDKGDVVHKGQLLGVLESPEVDQQVAGAEADLLIKRRTFERYQKLVSKDFVSAQDFETARAQFQVAQATLRQMHALQNYETLRAPFDGTVTARYADPGALVPAATGSTQSALPLVDVADLRRLRIIVFVQQDAAPYLHVGDAATIAVDQRPDLKISAQITRFAKALDPRSRMMLCEIWVDNEHHLYPGTFVHVTLHLAAPTLPVVPSSALMIRDGRPALAVIRDSRVRFVTIRPGLDDGRMAQILEGIKAGERVALNLPAELAEGALVRAEDQKSDKEGSSLTGNAQGGQALQQGQSAPKYKPSQGK